MKVDGSLHLTKVGSVSNTFDAAENPTKIAEPGGAAVNQTFDDAGQQLARTSGGSTTDFEFDANGRRTAEVVGGNDAALYSYDNRGRLVTLQTDDRDGASLTQTFAYAPSGDRLSTVRGALTKYESWGDLGGPASLLTHGRSAYVYGPGGMPLEFIDQSDAVSYLWQDAIGSVIGTTNTAGATSATFSYDSWGRRTAGFGSQAGVLGFAGQVTEPGVDLQYLRARYYDPKTASFLTRDPQEASTGQPYLYAAGNPMMFTDPTGEFAVVDAILGVRDKVVEIGSNAKNAIGGIAHGLSFDKYKPAWADSCSWWYLGGSNASLGPQKIGRAAKAGAKAARRIADSVWRKTRGVRGSTNGANALDDILPTPRVANEKLQNIVNNLYKGTTNPNRVGNGTTMDAVRSERATGNATGGRMHSAKARNELRGLNNWLRRNPDASSHDQIVARSLADELSSVLR